MCLCPITVNISREKNYGSYQLSFNPLEAPKVPEFFVTPKPFRKYDCTFINGEPHIFCTNSVSRYMRRVPHKTIQVPCGRCIECRLKKAKMWALRCVHEASFYKNNCCFLTLTYDDKHVPWNDGVQTLRYKDIQDFLKRLRKFLSDKNIKIRYFCSSEYGGKTLRPHYHMILYGYIPTDLWEFRCRTLSKKSYSGFPLFRSKTLESLWSNGMVFIGTVSEMSAGYVARYTMEKYDSSRNEAFYEKREKEAIRMSRRPGIGQRWIEKHWKNVCDVGFILNKDKQKHAIPRFYRNFIKVKNETKYEILITRLQVYAEKKNQEFVKECKGSGYLISYKRNNALNYRKYVTQRLKRRLNPDDFLTRMDC